MSRRLPLALVAALALLAGCDDDRRFTEQELIEELNGAGADLALGTRLTETEDGHEVTTVNFLSPSGEVPAPGEDGHGAGNVVVLDDTAEAEAEFARCQGTATLVCFRVANAVLRFIEISPRETARLSAAVSALRSTE